ncbi:DUF1120 domain-containing protein [Burkholderia cepacia]|uniref:DUF1120 domain-containing protein n=1 Tax=Burkholderia cepacia GG4 TaxID=1009846 RepID=A0A9W3PAZ8_BURCE|nr:DUF1120 domain-containing protein [Burkholderia cepacia]AFQ50031.1 hypothetical protein GEM_3641 [Burkholderia cepacia GG4]
MDLKQWCVLFVLACTLSGPGIASAADLSVSGRIQPGACSLTLGNGGTVDMGTISRKGLKGAEATVFNQHAISLAIQCQTPTKVAFRALDNRPGTSFQGAGFGLGASGGKSVGHYYLMPLNRIGDGVKLVQLVDRGLGWEVTGGTTSTGGIAPSWLSSWAELGHTLPRAFQSISSTLGVSIRIAPTEDLDLSQEIAIDGSATMELVYL